MKNLRNSKQRQIVLDAVRARCDHPSADQIYLDVRTTDAKISRGTVYRNLGILSDTEEILNVKVPSADRYDSRVDLHYHIYCTGCGKTFDAPLHYHSEYDEQVKEATGFQVKRHRLVFEGLCPECARKEKEK
ncbi:MAG: transcriptional repressor [Dorea sp.]|jgi:Fur family ferric uptake transcriptional regulator|nr:transcriptional repressor [Dorea sp.]